MTDRDQPQYTEEEAVAIWCRAARLQMEAAQRMDERSRTLAVQRTEGLPRTGSMRQAYLESAAEEAGIAPDHVQLAQAALRAQAESAETILKPSRILAVAGAALLLLPLASSAASAQLAWGSSVLEQEAAWYASVAAREMARNVVQYQSSEGAWPKNTDLARPVPSAAYFDDPEARSAMNTIDNGATTTPIRFLALVTTATGEPEHRSAIERGLDYLLRAQYPGGGWPQFYPLREGYYSHVTFNDDAMVRVMSLLREVARGEDPYAWVDEALRVRASQAVERGIELILRTQIRQAGELAGWCAQYDEETLAPAWARAYEPPSLSGAETVGIVRFLMDLEDPALEVVAAVDGAVAWLRAVSIHGVRVETFTAAGVRDRRVVADRDAGPIWARFYDLETNLPIFTGRDSVIRHALSEIEQERRSGYSYYGSWAVDLLEEYPGWRQRQGAIPAP